MELMKQLEAQQKSEEIVQKLDNMQKKQDMLNEKLENGNKKDDQQNQDIADKQKELSKEMDGVKKDLVNTRRAEKRNRHA